MNALSVLKTETNEVSKFSVRCCEDMLRIRSNLTFERLCREAALGSPSI